jgi:UDP-2,4-diacetamido-2,4,6-trideoxy-beta-L-altropyranose hydrolase
MRCLTLADALKQRGAQLRFVTRHLPKHCQDMLVAKGHELMLLQDTSCEAAPDELAHSHWLGTMQYVDAQDSIQALSNQAWDWLVVDHYALDARWESVLRRTAKNILVIDDIADRQHDCDVLLDQNFYADMETRYTGKVPAHCRLLLGPRHALVRDEFRQFREHVKPRTGPVKRVLVFFGGVDAANFTGCAVKALVNLGIEGLQVAVVIGAQHPHREQVELSCYEHQFECYTQTSRMAELMAAADLAIGAGGSATWERCCLGLPTFSICTADNQVSQVANAASEGLLYAPEIRGDLPHAIRRHLCALMDNDYLRQSISRNAMQAVDGRGVLRVIENMGCSDIKMRIASQEDSKQVFEWRNHPTVRAVSRNREVINWEDHQEWLASVIADLDRFLLIGQRAGVSLGVVRFDIQDDEAEISIYLVPGMKEPGLGHDLLRSAERWLVANRPDVRNVRAQVLGSNERSHRLFLGAEYQVESACYSKRLHQND